jgi:uncharacterized protein YecT (DUF1311 family)
MMRLAFLVLAATLMGFASGVQAAPSFDCSKASTRVENLICDHDRLAQLDSEMAAAYRTALRDSPWASANKRIRREQKAWLSQRNRCETKRCLRQLYRDRISALRAEVAGSGPENEKPQAAPSGVVYCGGGQIKRQIEYVILENSQDQWDVRVTINGETMKAMTAYSFFGKAKPPKGFVVALLGEDRSEMLVFRDGNEDWLEFGDYTYRKCN